ncbi:hypothetical protein CBL_14193 [Carabus blaptoides fortunei]
MNWISVPCVILINLLVIIAGQNAGISGKLDFGTSESTTSSYDSSLSTSLVKALVSLRQSSGPPKSLLASNLDINPISFKSITPLAKLTEQKSDFGNLGIVCVDGSCNTTQTKTAQSDDKVKTDVLVQVVTSLQGKENKSINTADTDQDVPIVIGYAGTNIQNPNLQSASRRLDGRDDVTIQTNPVGPNYNIYNGYKAHEHRRKENNFIPQVPYIDPAFNNHYFGEMQPQQFVWQRRRIDFQNANNPHAFVNTRPYKPFNQWQLKYPSTQHTPTGWVPTTTCTCSNPGLNWYPNFGPNTPTPHPSINDKMGPLN